LRHCQTRLKSWIRGVAGSAQSKSGDDTNDAFFLAELLRLNILPTGHIYDPELRPVRDLLRRRMTLVHHRTALMLSFKGLYTRTTGQEMTLSKLKELEIKEAQQLYEHPANQLIAGMQIKHIEQLTESIEKIEKGVLASARRAEPLKTRNTAEHEHVTYKPSS